MIPRARFAAVGRNLALAIGSLAIGLAVLEGVVRLAIDSTDVPRHRSDSLVGFGLEPAQEGGWMVGPIRSRFSINGHGYNNAHEYSVGRKAGRLRVAVLGDSFVEAFQVPPGQRFFDLLERDLAADGLDVEIYTFAVRGYGTGQQMLILERDVAAYRPDVVMTLFVSNDPSDTACALQPPPVKPCFSIAVDGSLRRRGAVPHRPNRLGRLVLRSALARYVLVQRRLLLVIRHPAGIVPAGSAIYQVPEAPGWAEAWRVVEACLGHMASFCRERGIRFLVIHQPLVDEGTRLAAGHATGTIDLTLPARRLREASARAGFEFIDLSAQLESAAALSPEPLLLEDEGHWSPTGHRSVATALRPILRETLAAVMASH